MYHMILEAQEFSLQPPWSSYSPPTQAGAGHQQTVGTSIGCNQWLSLAKSTLKVAPAGRNRSLVAYTSKCGWAIIRTSY